MDVEPTRGRESGNALLKPIVVVVIMGESTREEEFATFAMPDRSHGSRPFRVWVVVVVVVIVLCVCVALALVGLVMLDDTAAAAGAVFGRGGKRRAGDVLVFDEVKVCILAAFGEELCVSCILPLLEGGERFRFGEE